VVNFIFGEVYVDFDSLSTLAFWSSVGQIILIDILLGGDNAVVIALACRKLPIEQRKKGIFWGVFGAVGLRIVLIFFALQLLNVPFLRIVGALLLLWIGVKLLLPEEGNGHDNINAHTNILGAIKTIIIADAVMSVDNVIAVAGAAKGDLTLVIFGILVSIPIIVWGSKFVLILMDRFPAVITFGAGLLGWIAGEMILGDVVLKPYIAAPTALVKYGCATFGALLVISIGLFLAARQRAAMPAKTIELNNHSHSKNSKAH
jgi:YjbE family integral membrane protein